MKNPVVIVGVGALGSHVALCGRNWEQGLKVIDFDEVETKNTLAQFHSRMGLRRKKVQALQQAFQGLFGVKVQTVPYKLSEDNVEALLGDACLVIDCTDNAAARRCIQTFVKDKGIPCLHGALSASGDFARAVWTEHFVLDEEGEEGQATCEDGQQLPFFVLAGAQIAGLAQEYLLTGKKKSVQRVSMGLVRIA